MLFIAITPEFALDEESRIWSHLLANGIDLLHVRKPSYDAAMLSELIAPLTLEERSRIILHDHHELCAVHQLRGIHLNRRNPQAPQHFAGEISRSCHSLKELEQHLHTHDRLFLSPIFNSISKQDYHSSFTPATLLAAKRKGLFTEKVIALGGISAATIPLVRQYGFGGCAILGALWQGKRLHALSALTQVVQELRNAAACPTPTL